MTTEAATDLLSQTRLVREYETVYTDEGCPGGCDNSLTCPFPVCIEDDPYRPEFRGGPSPRNRERTDVIEAALRAGGGRYGVVKGIAAQFGVSTRTVYRIWQGMD